MNNVHIQTKYVLTLKNTEIRIGIVIKNEKDKYKTIKSLKRSKYNVTETIELA